MPAGRPKKELNEDEVFKLASYGCTQEEIGDFFGCAHSVISRNYAQAYNLGKASVRKNVRMWQMRRALKGSDTMLIHLGKHYLGQTDKPAPEPEAKETPATDENGTTLDP
jgi:hypothetical protein